MRIGYLSAALVLVILLSIGVGYNLTALVTGHDEPRRVEARRQLVKLDPDLKGTPVRLDADQDTFGPFTPVSMTRIGAGTFLVALYSNIYLFDENQRTAVPVKVNGDLPEWTPTGVFYSAFYDQVFVANYAGTDVVILNLNRAGDVLSLDVAERIISNFKGPEGIAISRGGRFMAIADHTGAQVSVFERDDGAWRFRWDTPMAAAHGLAIIDDRLYVGGTSIAEYNILTGEELARAKSLGDEPLLFATCLNEDGDTRDLIGTDPMAGRVFSLSPSLEVKTIFGANGPTFANFSMPYCAYREGKALYVLSTSQDRIIKIEDGVTTSFEFGAPKWQYVPEIKSSATIWHGTVKFDSPSFQMLGTKVLPKYGSLYTSDGTTLLMPARNTVDDNKWPFYLTTMAQKDGWLAIVANSSPVGLVYNVKSGNLGVTNLEEWDCWAMSDRVQCPSGERSVKDLVAKSAEIPHEPAPTDPAKYLSTTKGTKVPMLDYWRAWKAATD